MTIKDLVSTNPNLGATLLTAVAPAYEYVGGQRTDTITGYRYTVVLPAKGYDKLIVKIPGEKQMESPATAIPVAFSGLELGVYMSNNRPQIYAKATGIRAIKE